MVERLRDEGFRLVVATSSSGEELTLLLRQAQVDDLIEQATTSDEVERSKPDPDVVCAALAGALAIYDDPAALLDDFDRSPLAAGALLSRLIK